MKRLIILLTFILAIFSSTGISAIVVNTYVNMDESTLNKIKNFGIDIENQEVKYAELEPDDTCISEVYIRGGCHFYPM